MRGSGRVRSDVGKAISFAYLQCSAVKRISLDGFIGTLRSHRSALHSIRYYISCSVKSRFVSAVVGVDVNHYGAGNAPIL
jgi:hypothetical protein